MKVNIEDDKVKLFVSVSSEACVMTSEKKCEPAAQYIMMILIVLEECKSWHENCDSWLDTQMMFSKMSKPLLQYMRNLLLLAALLVFKVMPVNFISYQANLLYMQNNYYGISLFVVYILTCEILKHYQPQAIDIFDQVVCIWLGKVYE